MPKPSSYVPGVCNIGPAEIAMRRRTGHVALFLTIALWATLIIIGASATVRFWVAVPAAAAAVCYLQAYMHFCANFGWRGVFNVSSELRAPDTVAQAEYRRADRLKALQILGLSTLIGISSGLVAVWL